MSSARAVAPFAPLALHKLQRYYEAIRPFATHRYSDPCGITTWTSPLASQQRFPRSVHAPVQCSRRLYAGHRVGRKQVAPTLIPVVLRTPGFDDVYAFRHLISGSLAFAFTGRT